MLVDVHTEGVEKPGGYLLGPPDHAQRKELRLKHLSSSQSQYATANFVKMDAVWLTQSQEYKEFEQVRKKQECRTNKKSAASISICFECACHREPGGKTYETYYERSHASAPRSVLCVCETP